MSWMQNVGWGVLGLGTLGLVWTIARPSVPAALKETLEPEEQKDLLKKASTRAIEALSKLPPGELQMQGAAALTQDTKRTELLGRLLGRRSGQQTANANPLVAFAQKVAPVHPDVATAFLKENEQRSMTRRIAEELARPPSGDPKKILNLMLLLRLVRNAFPTEKLEGQVDLESLVKNLISILTPERKKELEALVQKLPPPKPRQPVA